MIAHCLRHKLNGKSQTKLYRVWYEMKMRCLNPKRERYKYYGGKGITVCEEWIYDFSIFEKWALENGYAEGLTIDRIDVNGNYEPNNCRWVDMKTQCNNKTNNHYITAMEKTQSLAEWSREREIPYCRLKMRLRRGWSVERAFVSAAERK